jgi:hypothetical protein
VRNRGRSRFHPRACTRNVTASQFGQRSPAGSRQKKNTVAAIPRRMKNPTKTTTNQNTSDIAASHAVPAGETSAPIPTPHDSYRR